MRKLELEALLQARRQAQGYIVKIFADFDASSSGLGLQVGDGGGAG